jgi:hypothetical protein
MAQGGHHIVNATRFNALTRSLIERPSRRDVLRGLTAVGLGFAATRHVGVADAKKHKRKKHKKHKKVQPPTPNEFGCFEVGDPCTSADDCCSGICEGTPGKLQCHAHNTGTCEQGVPGLCEAANPTDTICNGGTGFCVRTTAGSNACIYDYACVDCRRDADCEALGHPPGSACAPWGGYPACADLYHCETSTACVFPAPDV